MPSGISSQEFETLVAQTGLPLSDAQKATLYSVYPIVQAMTAKVTAPLPREAEPALIFVPEVR